MSKTLGTVIDPHRGGRRGSAPIRCGCISSKEIAFGGDGDFSWERYDERYNVDLANNLGNLVSRVTAMAHRYRQAAAARRRGAARRTAGAASASRRSATTGRRWTRFALHEGAAAAYRLIDATNEFIAATAPWALAKDPASADRLDAGAVRRGGGHPPVRRSCWRRSCRRRARRSCGASAAPTRRRCNLDRDGRWRNEGERVARAQDGPLWPRKEHDDRDQTHPARTTPWHSSPAPSTRHSGTQHPAPPAPGPSGTRHRHPGTAPAPGARHPARPHLHRRLHEGRAARREGAGRRTRAEVEQAAEAQVDVGHRAADDRRRHRRGVRARGAGRPDGRRSSST